MSTTVPLAISRTSEKWSDGTWEGTYNNGISTLLTDEKSSFSFSLIQPPRKIPKLTMAPSKQDVKISIAVAGLGRMGKRHVRTLLNRVSAAQVIAVCSTEPTELEWARNEYKDWGIKVYDSYDQMIQHSGLEAVWVSTSTDVHASQTIVAIEKGLNVLCEKPLSTDMEEVRRRLALD